MRRFECPVCTQTLYFENSVCVSCGSTVGYSRVENRMLALDLQPAGQLTPCVNLDLNGCNWIPDVAGQECFACELTRTRPNDADARALPLYYEAEQAKRRLVFELDTIGLPLDRLPALRFDLLSSAVEPVTTGHVDGVITIDLAEGDDVHREQVRRDMGEAYRTMLGHFRHETGHYYELLLGQTPAIERVRQLFGDDTADYQAAIERHYSQGPPAGWEEQYVSAYATMHPFEDFAETFAHVLHIRDALETAHAFALSPDPNVAARDFGDVVVGTWLPLSYALNQINRSMGEKDLYPFVLAPAVIDKLRLVNGLLVEFPS
ncbi:MAG: putative zinc-binding metallopeptidase [Nocardioidaceae bacterium]